MGLYNPEDQSDLRTVTFSLNILCENIMLQSCSQNSLEARYGNNYLCLKFLHLKNRGQYCPKYQTLKPMENYTGDVFASYEQEAFQVQWVQSEI